MRRLYWKIFLSFWIATTLIIISTIWITGVVTRKSSIPVREKIFINSYANAAVATYESGHEKALKKWLHHVALDKHLTFFLLQSKGNVVAANEVPPAVKRLEKEFKANDLPDGIFRRSNLIISHEILTLSQNTYRLVTILETPMAHLIRIPWADISFEFFIVIIISGLICYFLSIYLTRPIRSLTEAAGSIAKGYFDTRVEKSIKNRKDEIAELSNEFDHMAEQIEQLILSKEQLLQDISHELRSPLARLQVALTLVKDKSGDNVQQLLFRMELEVDRLNELIGDILSLAKLHKPHHSYQFTKVDISYLIELIIQDANFEYKNNEVAARFEDHADKPLLLINEKLMHHAIENIIRNGLRYTKKHTELVVHLYKTETAYQITIEDSGPGVPVDSLNTIFSPFYRVDSSREKKTGGFGLGLAIAKKAVEVHGGDIVAKNRASGGLKITITLPINNQESALEKAPNTKPA